MSTAVFGLFSSFGGLVANAQTSDVEDVKNLLAAQVRDQGHTCDEPQSATKEENLSKPDEEVWDLECEDATYRVKLVPDMAAEIEKIE
ncbi:hypothetical protein GR183_15555 [Stappia sp. GBMRC 2046]|uniref:Uncharacterized protein n=1 Tax=Stappia sediminis TaxID=2692190 RepID=A0A7X3S927_9HYPH|nr:hypothetical protein [Stappia sediminis]